jgi:hypothetical protein
MEVIPIASSLLKSLLSWLPGFLLRWYYTPARLGKLVYVDLMPRLDSAFLNLGPAASFQIIMQVINLSPFPVVLERSVIRLNCGTSPLEATNIERHGFQPGELGTVTFRNTITDGHADQIVQWSPMNYGGVDGVFEFACRLHPFTRHVPSLGGIHFRRMNEHLRRK